MLASRVLAGASPRFIRHGLRSGTGWSVLELISKRGPGRSLLGKLSRQFSILCMLFWNPMFIFFQNVLPSSPGAAGGVTCQRGDLRPVLLSKPTSRCSFCFAVPLQLLPYQGSRILENCLNYVNSFFFCQTIFLILVSFPHITFWFCILYWLPGLIKTEFVVLFLIHVGVFGINFRAKTGKVMLNVIKYLHLQLLFLIIKT